MTPFSSCCECLYSDPDLCRRREAKKILKIQADIDESEKEYLLEYYSLVRAGMTNYIATTAFHDVTGEQPTQPDEFFRMYSHELRPKKKVKV